MYGLTKFFILHSCVGTLQLDDLMKPLLLSFVAHCSTNPFWISYYTYRYIHVGDLAQHAVLTQVNNYWLKG